MPWRIDSAGLWLVFSRRVLYSRRPPPEGCGSPCRSPPACRCIRPRAVQTVRRNPAARRRAPRPPRRRAAPRCGKSPSGSAFVHGNSCRARQARRHSRAAGRAASCRGRPASCGSAATPWLPARRGAFGGSSSRSASWREELSSVVASCCRSSAGIRHHTGCRPPVRPCRAGSSIFFMVVVFFRQVVS